MKSQIIKDRVFGIAFLILLFTILILNVYPIFFDKQLAKQLLMISIANLSVVVILIFSNVSKFEGDSK